FRWIQGRHMFVSSFANVRLMGNCFVGESIKANDPRVPGKIRIQVEK
ncbi:MAG: hypothetical protein QOF94_1254, partial [Acidobacteriaceae bacterium]